MLSFDVNSPKLILINETGKWLPDDGRVTISNGCVVIAAGAPVYGVQLVYDTSFEKGARFFGDDWERGYGTLEWRGMVAERLMPWYMQADENGIQSFIGVMVQPGAFVGFRSAPKSVTVDIDTRSGGGPVDLSARALEACTIVADFNKEADAFDYQRDMLKKLCPAAKLSASPVYGGNNWYYAYGLSCRDDIISDSAFISRMAGAAENRPYMVIDCGWNKHAAIGMDWDPMAVCEFGGPWVSNEHFGDMTSLAARMNDEGVQAGIWIRPLLQFEKPKNDWSLHRGTYNWTLDPSNPEVIEYIAATIRRLNAEGFTLIKPDFLTFDMFRHWGFHVKGRRMQAGIEMSDKTRTNAEITRDMYRAIAEASGDNLIIGCNTVSHIAAGLFQINRTGDDTSGLNWERTRYMGINTLAMRMPQHRIFYDCDADCSPITNMVDWKLAKAWLEVLSRSGTPLFLSTKPGGLNAEQEKAVMDAFARAAVNTAPARPLDWQDNTAPAVWQSVYGRHEYDFDSPCYDEDGCWWR